MYRPSTKTTISISYLFLMLMITSACLQVAAPAPSATGTPPPAKQEPESGAVFEQPTARAKQCATVTAIQSVYVREEPNAKSRVISWLSANAEVEVTDSSGKWWRTTQGYINSTYLERSNCK